MLVSVIVVNWNGKHLLAECLGSLLEQEQQEVEIILVDNGSTDGSAAFVREAFPSVRIVELPANLGFAGGNNAGIRIARGKYIALLNNDTRTDTAWLSHLVSEAESGPASVGMWASKILSYDHPDTFDNVGLLLYPDGLGRGRGRLDKDRGQYDQVQEALFPSGCAALYRKAMLDEIGLLDEEFFAYADDVDLGLRARLAGWGCIYVPTAKVYHKYSASSSAYSPLKAFLVERNRIRVLLKYFPPELILISPLVTLVRLVFHLVGAISGRGASGKFAEQQSVISAPLILLRAWWAALLSLPQIVRRRISSRPVRRIGRREFYRLLCKYRISAREVALKE
jgi:GT2 family glycosyltransferase